MCFGNREKINKHLSTAKYADSMPLIPKDHLYASSAIHPEDHSMSWLLHTKVVSTQATSKQTQRTQRTQRTQHTAAHIAHGVGCGGAGARRGWAGCGVARAVGLGCGWVGAVLGLGRGWGAAVLGLV